MRKKVRRTAVVASAAGALVVGGAVGVVASQGSLAERQGGPGVAQEDPLTGEDVAIDRDDNVVKALGETGGLVDDSGNPVFTIALTGVEATETCPARAADRELTSENGTFLYVSLRSDLSEDIGDTVAAADEDLFLPLMPKAFSITGPDGTVHEGIGTESSWACLEDEDLVSAAVGPGSSSEGILVLDSPVSEGTINYDPDRNGGWTWGFGS